MPDFRAAERSFQLLTQVAGRAGRGEVKGEVLVQTCSPFNPPIMFAAEHDYEGFYQEEIAVREELKYPPFGHMMIVHFRGEDPAEIMAAATALMEKIQPCIDPETIVSEPAPRANRTCQGQIPLHGDFPAPADWLRSAASCVAKSTPSVIRQSKSTWMWTPFPCCRFLFQSFPAEHMAPEFSFLRKIPDFRLTFRHCGVTL